MDTPRVSIIIPIFKTEKYLCDCLLSVQRQTMPDFEAILVNDCTPDNSMQIANEFATNDSRFHILNHENNSGAGCARNTGLHVAHGEYINFLDSDDRLPADALQVLLELAESHTADMVIGNMAWLCNHHLSAVKYINHRILSWSTYWTSNLRSLPGDACFIGSPCNRLVKKKILLENSIFFPENIYHEDIPFTLKLWFYCQYIAATQRYVYLRTFRNDPENLSVTQTYNEKAFFDRDVVAQYVLDFAMHHSDSARLGVITLNNMLSTVKSMMTMANADIKNQIVDSWYPKHFQRINNMVNELNEFIAQNES